MKKFMVVGLALGLAGCAVPGGTGGPVTTAELSATVKQVQDYARFACKFVPTVATVAAILSGGASASVATIATEICSAVTTSPLADGDGGRVAFVRGVRIHGKFVE